MTIEAMERDFRRAASEQVRVAPEGPRRYRVFTPFRFDDGDHLAIALKREDEGWVLSDEAHTCMRFGDDLGEAALRRRLRGAAPPFRVEDRDGELMLRIRTSGTARRSPRSWGCCSASPRRRDGPPGSAPRRDAPYASPARTPATISAAAS